MVQEKIQFKDTWPFCSVEWNHLCNFGKEHYESGPVVQEEMPFKDISYLELWQPFVCPSGTNCAIMLEGLMRNISVILF